jgi:hypothetical protein
MLGFDNRNSNMILFPLTGAYNTSNTNEYSFFIQAQYNGNQANDAIQITASKGWLCYFTEVMI